MENVDVIAEIVVTYIGDMPLMGLITINEDIDNSKLTMDYLTPLFLQQFIKTLGFRDPYENDQVEFSGIFTRIMEDGADDEDYVEIPLKDMRIKEVYIDSENIINYARKYFDCELELDKNYLELDDYNNIYWPSRLLLGEIMTKIDDYKKRIISRFTLALLEDFGYLYVVDDSYFTGGLMRFGKLKGCVFVNGVCSPDDTN